jgi:adenosylcobinamide kinase/adenosylcobinamide-phosphate guanylyltransferase
VTFVIGGARSGKSEFAESLAGATAGRVTYIATSAARDAEMASRIAAHKARRPEGWDTWEGPVRTLPEAMTGLAASGGALLLDSLTAYLSALFADLPEGIYDDEAAWRDAERALLEQTQKILSSFREAAEDGARLVIVSDEAGCGVVPPYPMGRRFRDALGAANQIAAKEADEAALVTAGLPVWLKTRA